MVTFTLSWLNASSWGGGKKSSIIRSLPRGSFVYFIFSFIDCLSSSPITSTKNPDHVLAVGKPYGHDAATGFSKESIHTGSFASKPSPSFQSKKNTPIFDSNEAAWTSTMKKGEPQ